VWEWWGGTSDWHRTCPLSGVTSRSNLLAQSPRRALLGLAAPLLATGGLNLASMLGDRLWIGWLGRDALAGLAGAHAVWMLLFTAILGLSLGTLAGVARARGAGDDEEAAASAGAGLAVALGVGGLAALLAWPVAWGTQPFLAPTPAVAEPAALYLAIVFAGALLQAPLMAALFALQGAGEARAALRAGAIYPLANLVLTPLLLIPWGLAGAALATVLANALALGAALWLLRSVLGVRVAHLRPTRTRVGAVASVGVPRTLEHAVRNGAGLVLVVLLAPFGSSVLAGYAAALGVLLLLIHPGLALGQAAAACVGQSLGAGRLQRAWSSAWWAAGLYAAFLALAGLVLQQAAPSLIGLFDRDPETVAAGSLLLRTLAPVLPLLGVGLVLGKAFGGARRARLSLLAATVAHIGVQIPLVLVLGNAWGVQGAFAGMAAAYAAHGAVAAGLFAWNFHPQAPALQPAGMTQ
jgi:putative MATE family efflux protein